MSDADLIQTFATTRADDAFAQLVSRHIDFVYASALRQTRSPALAEDIVQAVFIHLAQHARKLRRDTHLKSWLCVITRYKAVDAIRSESRRRHRQETAAALAAMDTPRSHLTANNAWAEISPAIDDALASLSESDRRAILLRFFEDQTLREIGHRLGVSEDSAQKRLGRALEKLRTILARRGIATTSAFLAAQLPVHAGAVTAPATLATSLTAPAFLTTAAAIHLAATSTFIQSSLMTVTQKNVLVTAFAILVPVAIFEATMLASQNNRVARAEELAARLQSESETLQSKLERAQGLARNRESARASVPAIPDPLETSMLAVMERVTLLQRAFESMPELRIPELRFLSETDWMWVAVRHDLKTVTNLDYALSQVRNKARVTFNPLLKKALEKYLLASRDKLPETPLALLPYFDPPVDVVLLSRYEMSRQGTATEAGPSGVVIVEKKSDADRSLDTLSHTAMMRTRYVRTDDFRRPGRLTQEMFDALERTKRPVLPNQSEGSR